MDSLQKALIQVLRLEGFHGLAEISVINTDNGEKLDLTVQDQQTLAEPVAFTAASTIKIPVMVSVFRRIPEPAPEGDLQLVRNMIEASDNPSTDLVVQTVIDEFQGPLEVTSDLQALGYQNTFWAGYFYDGAPLLRKFETPANRSPAYDVHPDIYNQTTSADMADLLREIERCARDGSGKLIQAFEGEITQSECQQMIEILKGNWLPVLIKAGLPEGTPAGHKHGWISGPDEIVHTFSDVALVEAPKATYALAIYLYSDEQLLFDPANLLFSRLSRVVYNFFNQG
jgi:beta-lactamase class A